MMALENNQVVDSDAELKAFLSSILSSEGIVVNINRTFIAYTTARTAIGCLPDARTGWRKKEPTKNSLSLL